VKRSKEFSKRCGIIEEVVGFGENAKARIAMIEEIISLRKHHSNEMAKEDDESIWLKYRGPFLIHWLKLVKSWHIW
jgi:hypothetical protein